MSLVLLDLDKTLIDTNYCLTVPEDKFRKIVQELAKKGVRVGLCSDSTLLSLRQWAIRLELTGPVIAERGAVVWDPVLGTKEIIDVPATGWFQDLRSAFLSAVTRRFPEATVVVGDVTEFVRHGTVFTSMTQQVLLVNSFRLASFSFFSRRFSCKSLVLERDAAFLREAAALTEELVSSFGRKKENLFWDESPEYAVLIVHANTSEKHYGVTYLARRYGPQKIVMVGDSIADHLNLSDVLQFAVGNASLEYKAKCTFVSEHQFTEGVIDGLRQFL